MIDTGRTKQLTRIITQMSTNSNVDESGYQPTSSGLLVPQKGFGSKSRPVESDEQFLNREDLRISGDRARLFVTIILALAAITSFSTGAIGVWQNLDWMGVSGRMWARYVAQGLGAGLVLITLLDGSRLGWGYATTADRSTPWMQNVAIIMQVLNFGMSAFISVIGLPPLLAYLGLPLDYDAAWIRSMLTLVLSISFLANICTAFFWLLMSPKSQQMTTMSQIETERQGMYLTKIKKMLKQSRQREGGLIDQHLEVLISDDEMRNFSQFARLMGYEYQDGGLVGNGTPADEARVAASRYVPPAQQTEPPVIDVVAMAEAIGTLGKGVRVNGNGLSQD